LQHLFYLDGIQLFSLLTLLLEHEIGMLNTTDSDSDADDGGGGGGVLGV
jgi:hypothetical protein